MLRYVFGSCTGRAHKVAGGCGADSVLAMYVGDTLYFALSDGAGSSSLSHRVSDMITYEGVRLMIEGMSPHDVPMFISPMIADVFSGIDKRQLYATLLIGTYSKGILSYTSIGDSVVLYRSHGRWYASPVIKGEFANETVFLLSEGWKETMKTGIVEGVDAIVVSSDGLGGVYFFYKFEGDLWYVEPSETYLNRLIDAVRDDELTFDNINLLLCNDQLMDINDDDKSVVIAYGGV